MVSPWYDVYGSITVNWTQSVSVILLGRLFQVKPNLGLFNFWRLYDRVNARSDDIGRRILVTAMVIINGLALT